MFDRPAATVPSWPRTEVQGSPCSGCGCSAAQSRRVTPGQTAVAPRARKRTLLPTGTARPGARAWASKLLHGRRVGAAREQSRTAVVTTSEMAAPVGASEPTTRRAAVQLPGRMPCDRRPASTARSPSSDATSGGSHSTLSANPGTDARPEPDASAQRPRDDWRAPRVRLSGHRMALAQPIRSKSGSTQAPSKCGSVGA